MSIVACVKVYDGIVLGADSMSQLTAADPGAKDGGIQFVKAYSNAQKLFAIGEMKIGILAYGVGNIGKRSVESYILDFTESTKDKPTNVANVEAIARGLYQSLSEVFRAEYKDLSPESWPELGVYIAGYSTGRPTGEEWEFKIPKKGVERVRADNEYGASWRGIAVPFTRLFRGFDPRIYEQLEKMLESKKLPKALITELRSVTAGFTAPIAFDGMPLQDALDFCKFILSTTVGMATFETGVATCGGPLDIAVITRTEGFSWIQRKKLAL